MSFHWTDIYSSMPKLLFFMSLYSKNPSLDSSLSFKRWEKVLGNFFSSPAPWLYHTSPKPCLSSSSFTLPSQDTLPLSARFWEDRYAPKGSRSWFSFRCLSQYFNAAYLEADGQRVPIPLSQYTMLKRGVRGGGGVAVHYCSPFSLTSWPQP